MIIPDLLTRPKTARIFALTGSDLDSKAALVERAVHRDASGGLSAVAIDRIGHAQHDPDSQNAGTELLRIAVQGTQEAAGRAFSARMVELALSSYPGLYALGPPQPGSAFGVYWPALLDQAVLEHVVHHHDGTTETITPGHPRGSGRAVGPAAEPVATAPTWTADELVVAPLGDVVHARSGDKGGDANVGVWVRDRQAWDWLRTTLTVEQLRTLATDRTVTRFSAAQGLPAAARPVPRAPPKQDITGSAARLSARYSTTARVSGSAQCRSSRTSRSPRSPASSRNNRSTPSASTTGDSSTDTPARRQDGINRPSAGRNDASTAPSSPRAGSCRNPDSSASASGRNAVLAPTSTARPTSTGNPAKRASAPNSRSNRVFPIPGAPRTAAAAPRRSRAPSNPDRNRASSRPRPISTGHLAALMRRA